MSESTSPVRDLQWAIFMVNERPRCMWGDLDAQNHTFLTGIDPHFFNYLADTHVPALEGDRRQHAALAIRLIYGQALETLFALIAASIQAPRCPLGWVLSYQNRELYSFVNKLLTGSQIYSLYDRPFSWMKFSERIHRFNHDDPSEDRRVKQFFADTWATLAVDFCDSTGADEYNSIKHGLRVRSGGFHFRMGAPDSHLPVIDSKSEFGTQSFHVERLSDDGVNYYAQDAFRNWSPIALAVRIELISLSISNIVAYLLTRNSRHKDKVRFEWPEENEALNLAWKQDFIIQSMQGGFTIDPREIEPRTKLDILKAYQRD